MRLEERFHYLGPNHRTERAALELILYAEERDEVALAAVRTELPGQLARALERLGLEAPKSLTDRKEPAPVFIAQALAWVIRSLLEAAGHAPGRPEIFDAEASGALCVVMEADDADSDFAAITLAVRILAETAPGLLMDTETGNPESALPDAVARFLEKASVRAMTPETRAILDGARALGVWAMSLDRKPFGAIAAERRIRPNGMVMLGQGKHQRVLDGPVFVDSRGPVLNLLWNHELRRTLLQKMRVPPATERPGAGMHKAFLMVGEALICSLERTGDEWRRIEVTPHPSLTRIAQHITRLAESPVILVEVTASDLAAPPGSATGTRNVIDFDLAPRLDRLLEHDTERLNGAARRLVQWAFPPGATSTVPSVVVTGTNGKTTTSMMIRRMLSAAGRSVGLACSRGVLIGEELVSDEDSSGLPGHVRVFDDRAIDVAVLETARGAVRTLGFAFDHCDVSVCTNVAEDHIGVNGVHTLQDMAEIKLSIARKARKAAVLNADDDFCEFMYSSLEPPRLGIVSLERSLEQLQHAYPRADTFCTLSGTGEKANIGLYSGGVNVFRLAVNEIPATFAGRARFNVENAMQAMVACHFMEADLAAASDGLVRFQPGFDQLMGRLNIHQGEHFTVIMDYAHNAAGLRRFLEFARTCDHHGKRVVVCGVPGDRTERQARDMMGVICEFYDEFVLRPSGRKKKPGDLMAKPRICRDELLKLGVPDQRIHLAEDAIEAVRHGLEMCREGDLMVLHLTSSTQPEAWELVTGWPGNPASAVMVQQ